MCFSNMTYQIRCITTTTYLIILQQYIDNQVTFFMVQIYLKYIEIVVLK